MTTRKIVILGGFGVGKTSLIRRYVLDEFSDVYRATLGVHLYKHSATLDVDGAEVAANLVLWDIEGVPEPVDQTKRYIAGASGAIIVGDITRPATAETMAEMAFMFERHCPARPIAFAINKTDLAAAEGAEAAFASVVEEFDAPALRTSARTGSEVMGLFNTVSRLILARNM